MFRFVPKRDNLHLFPQDIDRFLRILEISVALCDVYDSLDGTRVVLSVIVGLRDEFFLEVADGSVGGGH